MMLPYCYSRRRKYQFGLTLSAHYSMLFLGRPLFRGGVHHHHHHGVHGPVLFQGENDTPTTQFRVSRGDVVDIETVGEGAKAVTYYVIDVSGDDESRWTVKHRYESFRTLMSQLQSECYCYTGRCNLHSSWPNYNLLFLHFSLCFCAVCAFPPRFWFWSLDDHDKEIRRRELQVPQRTIASLKFVMLGYFS